MTSTNISMALSSGHPLSGERVLRIPPANSNTNTNKVKVFNGTTRIATWNVRSLFMAGKLANVDAEMSRLQIKILGLSEVRWPGSGKQDTENGVIYYSGGDGPGHQYGVAIMIAAELSKSVLDFIPLGERVMLLKLNTSRRTMNIIQAYAPTNDRSDDLVEDFYNTLGEAMTLTKKGEITVVLGDFNAKLGSVAEEGVTGEYGLGERNSRGDRLVQFCIEHDLCVANTLFKNHPRRLYTWCSPADRCDHLVRNQIDFVLLKREFRKCIKSTKTYPGADINSDHNPVVMDMRIRRFVKNKFMSQPKRIDVRRLDNPIIRAQISQSLESRISTTESNESNSMETLWEHLSHTLTTTQETDIGFVTSNKKQQWMTDEILLLMNERRQQKTKNNRKYRELNKIIRRKCGEAKEAWLRDKCKEIEDYQSKYDLFNVHKSIKQLTGRQHKKCTGILRDSNGKILVGADQRMSQWQKYVEDLFNDVRSETPPLPEEIINEDAPQITKDEVRHAIHAQKNGKAVGPDGIHAETLKLISSEDGEGLSLLTSLFNMIYRTGKIPSVWLKSTFVTLPKRSNAARCDDYRVISLMSHVLKTFLRVIHTRIYRKCEGPIGRTQFGFRNGMGTREALFSLNVLTQRCRDMNVNVFTCFIDYRKAFDCVSHEKLIRILKSTGIDAQDLRIISELYWHQTATINSEGHSSEEIAIRRGVRQGCVLSPILFNLYSEAIFAEALENTNIGIKINGNIINNLRYADDTVLLAGSLQELQLLVDHVVQHSERYGLYMNGSKTKLLVYSKAPIKADLMLHGAAVQQVTSLKYLGTTVNQNNDIKTEIKSRIEQARRTLTSMKVFLANRDLDLALRTRLLRCCVFPVLLYGCESWTLDPGMERRIDAFEMYAYRRMLRVSWTEHKTNVHILQMMKKDKELLLTIKERKIQYLGHVMRGSRYEILRLIIEGKIDGKRSVGRRQNSWLKDLRRWLGRSSTEIFRAAVSRTILVNWIANLRRETAS